MNEVSLTQKVSDHPLTALNVQDQGSLLAVGDADGNITLLQLCESLVKPGPNEKAVIGQMLERETKREKNLEAIKKQGGGKKKQEEVAENAPKTIDEAEYRAREKAFFAEVGMTGDDHGTTLASKT